MNFFPWTIEAILSEKKVGIRCSYLAIDGNYSAWSKWGECNSQCVQVRSRNCTNPAPKYSGKNCTGPSEEFRNCTDCQSMCSKYIIFYFQLNVSITSDKLSLDELGVSVLNLLD